MTTVPAQEPSKTEGLKAEKGKGKGRAAILFTAFEPSGDAHAAPVIKELLEKVPGLKIYAWGGAKMRRQDVRDVQEVARGGWSLLRARSAA